MKKCKHKHDWQLLKYGFKPTYVGTKEKMVALIACRECGKVLEKEINDSQTKNH